LESGRTAKNLKEQFSKEIKETPSSEVGIDYEMVSEIDWKTKEEILIKDKSRKKIFYNQKFADGSVFGENCVFIKCEFGSYCDFGTDCEFGSYCKFGTDCEKSLPYWDENGKHE